jgi:FtsH-binding integral membrane protein
MKHPKNRTSKSDREKTKMFLYIYSIVAGALLVCFLLACAKQSYKAITAQNPISAVIMALFSIGLVLAISMILNAPVSVLRLIATIVLVIACGSFMEYCGKNYQSKQ